MYPNQQWRGQEASPAAGDPEEETDNSHRPPNAFILYSQAMRSTARQQNPSLSNTEVSALLGKMWKEVPSDVKVQYKQKAAVAQEEFKRQHPNYTYRKARRKRALNELLTKSAQGYPIAGYPTDPNIQAMMGAANPYMLQMYGQAGQQIPMGMPMQLPPGMPGQQGQPGQPPPGYPMGAYPGAGAYPGYQGK
jgi:transcription factor SOX7/8/10/18 (SOX group E/F)